MQAWQPGHAASKKRLKKGTSNSPTLASDEPRPHTNNMFLIPNCSSFGSKTKKVASKALQSPKQAKNERRFLQANHGSQAAEAASSCARRLNGKAMASSSSDTCRGKDARQLRR